MQFWCFLCWSGFFADFSETPLYFGFVVIYFVQLVSKKGLSKFEKLTLLADMCRPNTLVSIKKAGSGHLGSSLSAMDIIIYLYDYNKCLGIKII